MKHICRCCGQEIMRSEAWELAFLNRTTLAHAEFCDKPACRKALGLQPVKRGLSHKPRPYDGPWSDEPGDKKAHGSRV